MNSKTVFLCYFPAKAEISDEKLEELLEKGNYGSIFNGDVSSDNGNFQFDNCPRGLKYSHNLTYSRKNILD